MRFFILFLCIIGILADFCASAPNPISKNDGKTINYRLTTDIEPFDYVLEFTPYLENSVDGNEPFTFDGICNISIRTSKHGINTITLHKQDLKIIEQNLVKFAQQNVEYIEIKSNESDDITKKYTLKLAKPLIANEVYVLNFKYIGRLQTDMLGFYRSSYKEGNDTKWLASTKLEPIHARKVFPSFDEPRFKATFSIIINRPAHFKPSLSNTPLVSSYLTSSNTVREHFAKTPKMSTYLVAFIVSEFECRKNQQKNFNVCSRPNAYDQTEYSFQVGQKSLKTFDSIFDYKYNKHMAKMTMAAIPDFVSGAMENWGLITFRESSLLFDSKVATAMNQQRIATVVAHEQTHMWFGDLVTCDWWSHTWLNEGFAEFFQYFGMDLVESSWNLNQQFVVDQLHGLLDADSLENSQSLSHDVNAPDEIQSRFGTISYSKGASIIRMMQHTLGSDKFIAGLRNYLKTNALETGVPEKLYAAFQSEVGTNLNITELMDAWVYQPGYPILNVQIANDRKHIVIAQKRFLRNNPNHSDKTRWNVPITYASDKFNSDFSNTKPVKFLSGNSLEIKLTEPIDWIVINVQQSGYYRVNYDDDTWSAITNILYKSPSSIHVLNRAQMINDALTFARADLLTYEKALQLVRYLKNETDYVPWTAAFSSFSFILGRFKPDERHIFEEFELGLLNKVYDYLGFKPKDSDTRLDIYNRNNVLKFACRFGHKQCIADARNEFDQLLRGNYTIPVDLAPVVYCSAVAEGSDKEWNFLWNKFNSVNIATEQATIMNALGCTKKTNLIMKYLKLILSDAIRLQDKHSALVATLTQRQNLPAVLDFIMKHYQDIDLAFKSDKEVPNILSEILSLSTTHEEIDKIQKFTEEHQLDSNRSLKAALESAKLNIEWAEKNIPIIINVIRQESKLKATF